MSLGAYCRRYVSFSDVTTSRSVVGVTVGVAVSVGVAVAVSVGVAVDVAVAVADGGEPQHRITSLRELADVLPE